ncbi:zinc ribbon domain-containing protein [Hyperthermus butylicus]|uniref:Uncharacterized protein n=1 Tax=Hyperthermus butylicus (strain DSM 5456 / JCM 9403 / PLM1-5) TaxID=415426 RepID=A2BJF7_HYPBU|nr:zinc ribbon domain-containing protein [Hyperthermus butylicus]ABM80118.1 hypothetical protein Hbut_0246 [Hyperthermus butylicus DSM 5456]
MSTSPPKGGSPEEKLTSIMTLAAGVDGVDLVVGAHEGLAYSVNAPNPEMQIYADELASLSTSYLEAASHSAVGGRTQLAIAGYASRSLLVADLGEGFTISILGDPRATTALFEPVRRILEGRPLKCPKCGAMLEIYTYTCPSCGRRLTFGTAVCPYCGAYNVSRTCPNCGTSLRLAVDRLEEATAPAARPALAEAAKERVGFTVSALRVLLAGAITAAYYLSSLIAGLSLLEATVAGAAPLAASYILLFTKK